MSLLTMPSWGMLLLLYSCPALSLHVSAGKNDRGYHTLRQCQKTLRNAPFSKIGQNVGDIANDSSPDGSESVQPEAEGKETQVKNTGKLQEHSCT